MRYIGYKLSIPSDTLDYNEVMKILNMKSLHERRIIYDRLFIFKLLNNYIVCPELLGFININVPARILRETNVFSLEHHRTAYGQFSSINRMMALSNGIECDIFNCSLQRIKRALAVS